MAVLSHSEPLRWEKIGKVVIRGKLAILNHFGGKRWKSCESGKIAVLSHSEPLQWDKFGKDANQVKLAVPSHYEPLRWEKFGKVATRAKLAVLRHLRYFSGKRLEKL